jgi:hypothetical protein
MQFFLKSPVVLLSYAGLRQSHAILPEKSCASAKLMQVYGRVMQFYLKSPVVLLSYAGLRQSHAILPEKFCASASVS